MDCCPKKATFPVCIVEATLQIVAMFKQIERQIFGCKNIDENKFLSLHFNHFRHAASLLPLAVWWHGLAWGIGM